MPFDPENPSASTEIPSALAEAPSASTEAPSASTEAPSVSTEKPSEGTGDRPVLGDRTVIQGFRHARPEAYAKLNADFSLHLTQSVFQGLQAHYAAYERRDPSAAELRVLDALYTSGRYGFDRSAISELYTDSPLIAETWADMMRKHAALHDSSHLRQPSVPPPCTLAEMGSLVKSYLRRTTPPMRRAKADLADEITVLTTPAQEWEAAAAGFRRRTTLSDDEGGRYSIWVRHGTPLRGNPARAGDILLWIPRIPCALLESLMEFERHKSTSDIEDVRVPVGRSLLLTLTDMCDGADIYVDRLSERLAAPGTSPSRPGELVPIRVLCGIPRLTEKGLPCLIRASVKRMFYLNEQLTRQGIPPVVIGRVRGDDRMVFVRPNGTNGTERIPLSLRSALLRSAAAVTARQAYLVDDPAAHPPVIRKPTMTIQPQGTDSTQPADAATLTRIAPPAPLTVTGVTVTGVDMTLRTARADITHAGQGFISAIHAVNAALTWLTTCSPAPDRAPSLSVDLVVEGMAPYDDRITETLCGLYRITAERGVPVENLALTESDGSTPLIRLTAVAWTKDRRPQHQNSST